MPPLFAFFPVCIFFASLGVLAVIMYLAGAGANQAHDTAEPEQPAGPRPPYWVFAAVLAAVVVGLLLLALVTDG